MGTLFHSEEQEMYLNLPDRRWHGGFEIEHLGWNWHVGHDPNLFAFPSELFLTPIGKAKTFTPLTAAGHLEVMGAELGILFSRGARAGLCINRTLEAFPHDAAGNPLGLMGKILTRFK